MLWGAAAVEGKGAAMFEAELGERAAMCEGELGGRREINIKDASSTYV